MPRGRGPVARLLNRRYGGGTGQCSRGWARESRRHKKEEEEEDSSGPEEVSDIVEHRGAQSYCTPVRSQSVDREEDEQPVRRFRQEASHGTDDRELLPRSRSKRQWETAEERRMRKMWEKQQQVLGASRMKQVRASMVYAKKQILEACSTTELLERAENLIEQDWLGKIDEMTGSMYFIGAFGDLRHMEPGEWGFNFDTLKNRARLIGCCVVALIQLFGPPAVFFSTIFGWGVVKGDTYKWGVWDPTDMDNALYDWRHIKLTKFLGIMFMLCFILNGLFVVLDGQQAFFKIYNMFTYLKRNTPNFDLRGLHFLYLGAFVDCWTVLWCCISSYVIVGASASPKDILFDALGLLFVYNLDDIGGDLGFVNEDDWPGLRLGWIHMEMVKKNWEPGDEEEPGEVDERAPCIKGCGRLVRPGTQPNGKPWDTCCRGCAKGEAHDEECNEREAETMGPVTADSYVGGETSDWDVGGWLCYCWYCVTALTLAFLTVFLPGLSCFTPFLKIVPGE